MPISRGPHFGGKSRLLRTPQCQRLQLSWLWCSHIHLSCKDAIIAQPEGWGASSVLLDPVRALENPAKFGIQIKIRSGVLSVAS